MPAITAPERQPIDLIRRAFISPRQTQAVNVAEMRHAGVPAPFPCDAPPYGTTIVSMPELDRSRIGTMTSI